MTIIKHEQIQYILTIFTFSHKPHALHTHSKVKKVSRTNAHLSRACANDQDVLHRAHTKHLIRIYLYMDRLCSMHTRCSQEPTKHVIRLTILNIFHAERVLGLIPHTCQYYYCCCLDILFSYFPYATNVQ